jgi:hypothetical protein
MSGRFAILLAMAGGAAVLARAQSTPFSIFTQADQGLTCTPQVGAGDAKYNDGCCGAPGLRACALVLNFGKGLFGTSAGCTDPIDNILRFDPIWDGNSPFAGYIPYNTGTAIYCNLPWPPAAEDSNLLPPTRPPGGTDFTFYVTSDLHFWRDGIDFNVAINHAAMLNRFAAQPLAWPTGTVNSLQTVFHPPAAVVIPGDFNTGSTPQRIGAYRLLWERGWNSESIAFPVYPGLGNHDISNEVSGFAWGPADSEDGQRAWDYVMNRAINLHMDRNATGCLIGVDSGCLDEFDLGGSLNYSWDWEGVHMIMLNTWAGDRTNIYQPPIGQNGLGWLSNDLAKAVGNSGRPVILFQHYGANDVQAAAQTIGNPWGQAEVDSLGAVIQGYNVIALFSGHSHSITADALTYTSGGQSHLLMDNIADGSGGDCNASGCTGANGNFLSVHVTDRYMEVAAVTWNTNVPNLFTIDPNDPHISYDGKSTWYSPHMFPGSAGVCRKRINSNYVAVSPAVATATADPNNPGNLLVKNLTSQQLNGSFFVSGSFSKWDFTDACSTAEGTVTGGYKAYTPYLVASETGISPNGQISIPFSGSGPFTVYTIADSLTVNSSSFNLIPNQPVSIDVSTLTGANVPFTYAVDKPWVTLSSQPSTPTTITANLVPQTSYSQDYITLTITPANSAYQPISVRLYITAALQITSNVSGAQVTVDGTNYFSIPYTTAVPLGQQLNLNLKAPRTAGYQYSFGGWSDSQPQQHSVIVSGAVNLAAVFNESDQVTGLVSPPGAGTVQIIPSPVNGFVPHNQTVQIVVTPASNYYFSSFGGDLTGLTLSSPTTFQVTGPTTFTVNFAAFPTVTLATNIPATEAYTVTLGSNTGAAPISAQFAPSSQTTLIVPMLVNSSNPGIRYQFQQWSDGVPINARILFPGSSSATYTANYATQVFISTSTVPANGGSVTGGGWFTVQSNLTLTAQAAQGFAFTAFAYNGSISMSNPLTFAAKTPLVATANFAATANVTISSNPPGLPFSADSAPFQTPATFTWLVNSQHTVAFGSIISGPTTAIRYQFSNWMDSNNPYVRPIIVGASNATYTAAFTTEYLMTASPSPASGGAVTGGGWYNSGSSATFQATAAKGFAFSSFSGDLNGTANPVTIPSVVRPLNLVANFAPAGVPVLNAAPNGAATDSNGLRVVPISLQNTGSAAAFGAQVDSVTGIAVLSGTGTVVVQPGPFVFGDVPAGGSATGSIGLTWPTTATRVRLILNFSANGGAYHGSTTLNLFR